MCQPKSKGGRRCPAHQPASIGIKKFMTAEYGLAPEQVEHNFKQLREIGRGRPAPTPADYAHLMQRNREKLENSNLSEKEKRSVLRQLDKELSESELPDPATFYALQKLQARSREQKAELVKAIREISQHKGINRNEAWKTFREAYANDQNKYDSSLEGELDPKTKAVVESLLDKDETAESGEPQFKDEPRIERQPISSSWISKVGYDPDDGRFEVELKDGTEYAYKDVPQELWERAQNSPGVISREIMRDPNYAYASQQEAIADKGSRYCEECHKYKAIRGHACEGKIEKPDSRKTIEEALSRIESQFDAESEMAERKARLAVPVEEREVVEFPAMSNRDFYSETDPKREKFGSAYIPLTSDLMGEMEQGKVITFYSELEHDYEVTTQYEAYMDEDGYVVLHQKERQCYCQYYQEKGYCEHLLDPVKASSIRYSMNRKQQSEYILAHLEEDGKSQYAEIYRSLDPASYVKHQQENNEAARFRGSRYYSPSSAHGIFTTRGLFTSDWKTAREAAEQGVPVEIEIPQLVVSPIHSARNLIATVEKNDDGELEVTQIRKDCQCYREECRFDEAIKKYIAAGIRGEPIAQDSPKRTPNYENLLAGERLKELREAAQSEWESNPEAVQVMSTFEPPTGVDKSYSSNIDVYLKDVREAERKARRGENPLPIAESNVTNGACAPGTGRNFGLEFEYVLDEDSELDDYEVRQNIARDLYEAGLSDVDHPTEYHGYSGSRWHIEEDCSVSGEVVSPKLEDSPEHWEEVRQVLAIIKKHGGTTSKDAGGHVHMGLGKGEPAEVERRKVAATQIYAAFEDSIRRVQTDPHRKKHRDSSYCSPVGKENAQNLVYDISQGYRTEEDHETSLNLGHRGRIEFRGGDGSLDLGHIQAQVSMAAGIVTAAERGEIDREKMQASPIGTNAKKTKLMTRGKAKGQTDDEIIVSDVSFRKFTDTVMNHEFGRKAMAGIAALVPWQETSMD